MKIIIDENIPFIKGRLEPFAETVYVGQNEFTPELVGDADAVVVRTRTHCGKSLLAGSSVSIVTTATIGTDHIDLDWCAANGIVVANAPGCNAPAVAQYVWASVAALGIDPAGLKTGVVGCGNVGGIVADWGRKMGAEVFVSDPPRQEAGFADNYHALDDILRECDVVTLHTPLVRDGKYPTFHLIGERELAIMSGRDRKPLLINAARGEVVDFKALGKVIEAGGIDAVIDTWENEPAIDRKILDEVRIGTFHIAGYSEEGKQRATRMVLEALDRRFGFNTDKSGLAGAYRVPENVDMALVAASYNPFSDSGMLKCDPDGFERLRHDYNYRSEVRFS